MEIQNEKTNEKTKIAFECKMNKKIMYLCHLIRAWWSVSSGSLMRYILIPRI